MKTIRNIIRLFTEKTSKKTLLILILTGIILWLARTYEPFFLKKTIDTLEARKQNGIDTKQMIKVLWQRCLYVILIITIKWWFLTLGMKKLIKAYHKIFIDAWETLTQSSYKNYIKETKGKFNKIIYDGLEWFWHIWYAVLLEYTLEIIWVIAVTTIIFITNRKFALITVATLPVLFFLTFVTNKKTRSKQQKIDKSRDKGYDDLGETMTNAPSIKTNTLEKKRQSSLKKTLEKALKRQLGLQSKWAIFEISIQIVIMLARLIVIAGGTRLYSKGETTIGEIILFFTYINFIYYPLSMMLSRLQKTQKQMIAFKKLKDKINEYDKTKEQLYVWSKTPPTWDIKINKVSFAYNKERTILKDLSFTIAQGKTTALVGHTGSGKSTIANILLRFRDIEQGDITRGKQDIQNISLETLRKEIGIIMQDTTLFNDSIYNNLATLKEKISDKEIKKALINAKSDFVFSLPQWRDTVIGERGLKLSGGEKQRIALARLFIKNPPFIILDEATSALDNKTEKQIKEVIDNITQNKTLLVIAHRLSTIKNADNIIVLDQGEIKEQGTYNELIKKKWSFFQLANPDHLIIS